MIQSDRDNFDSFFHDSDGPGSGLKWLFLDLNSYFASVEQQENPHLRGWPTAVIPMETDSTCAIAASYEAKAYGIKTGTKIYDAKKMCPHLKCVMARHDVYVAYHHKIISAISRHLPINKICSIDELSSRLPPGKRSEEAAKDIAIRTKQQIWDDVGPAINCSIGVAPNAFLAKVATDLQKPDGLVLLRRQDLPGPLFELDLMDLPGINVNMLARLHRCGIRTIEQLWHIPPKQARAIWGNVGGERFWYNLHGYDVPDIETKNSMIGHSRVLDPDLRHPDKARQMMRRLTVKACQRLRRKDYYAGAFVLSVRTIDERRWAREIVLDPCQDNTSFLEVADLLWSEMITQCQPFKLKKVAVTLHKLRRKEQITGNLFAQCDPETTRKNARRTALSRTMDMLNQKYGADTVQLGIPPRTLAGYVGTKIAFSRIPDSAEFSD